MSTSRKVARLIHDPAVDFYSEVLDQFARSGIPWLVGGTYALSRYVGWTRPTKDVDIFVLPESIEAIVEYFVSRGYDAELTFSHWLAKIRRGPYFVDVIFSSGNGIARVDEQWFTRAVDATIFGVPVKLTPPEEMIWSKAFVQERERYDGADVLHLFYHCAGTLDWSRLLSRFDQQWRVLFSYLVLFGFAYPAASRHIPAWVMDDLLARLVMDAPEPANRICNGTLLSREQYLPDLLKERMIDARQAPFGTMSAAELKAWTEAIGER